MKKLFLKWSKAIIYTILAVYLYVFMEWIFFVTKVSFMSTMNSLQKIRVFLLSSFIFVIPAISLLVFLLLISLLFQYRLIENILYRITTLVPVLILASLVFLMIDNFTHTVVRFGVVSTEGWKRGLYGILFLFLVILIYQEIWGGILNKKTKKQQPSRITLVLALSLVGISVFFYASLPRFPVLAGNERARSNNDEQSNSRLPNIILLSTDGLNSSHMSLYGYPRETTPFIKKYADEALIFQNAFANTGNTGGSITSLLTGKSSFTTRMYYPPDILTGIDSYQHLPGILKKKGYRTIQLNDPYNADAYTRNLINGFDIANSRSEESSVQMAISRFIGDGGSTYFNTVMIQRIMERLNHVFYISTMINPYRMVTEPAQDFSENERIETMLSLLRDANQPLFIEVHMLGTHGPRFTPVVRKFSEGKQQNSDWMVDFYDDAVLNFDNDVEYIFQSLKNMGKLDNTIVIVYSDHGMQWQSKERIPLLIWFPNGKLSGVVQENVQLLDIAPTLLDFLNIDQPEWMEGTTLIKEIPRRHIFSTNPADSVKVQMNNGLYEGRMTPPFYQLGLVTMIACDHWYTLNLKEPGLTYGEVDGSSLNCKKEETLAADDAILIILNKLRENGYDISILPRQLSIDSVP